MTPRPNSHCGLCVHKAALNMNQTLGMGGAGVSEATGDRRESTVSEDRVPVPGGVVAGDALD